MELSCTCVSSNKDDLHETISRGLMDWDYVHRMQEACPSLRVWPTAIIVLGSYSATVSQNPAVLAWWEQQGFTSKEERH